MPDLHRRLSRTGQIADDFPIDEFSDVREHPELHTERRAPIINDLVTFAVIDRSGKVRGMLALDADAVTMDDPAWILERVRLGTDKPKLRLA